MTFKHTKFEDSVTMRSLEKVAKDKGWVKQEDLIKSASPQIDLTPSGVLSIDILKLCSGLRHNGFDKFADEIELKFVNYKRAATSLYDSTGETGEDLIDAAHPKGSHKMEGVAGDATFHTILDKHLKIVDVVNKQPKGKLASNAAILNAVKIVLAVSPEQAVGEYVKTIDMAIAVCNEIANKEDTSEWIKIGKGHGAFVGRYTASKLIYTSVTNHLEALIDNLNDEKKRPANVTQANAILDYTETMKILVEKTDSIDPRAKQKYYSMINAVESRVGALKGILREETSVAPPQAGTPGAAAVTPAQPNNVSEKIEAAKRALNGIATLVASDAGADVDDVRATELWIGKANAALTKLETNSKNMNPEDVELTLQKITKYFDQVKKQWM